MPLFIQNFDEKDFQGLKLSFTAHYEYDIDPDDVILKHTSISDVRFYDFQGAPQMEAYNPDDIINIAVKEFEELDENCISELWKQANESLIQEKEEAKIYR